MGAQAQCPALTLPAARSQLAQTPGFPGSWWAQSRAQQTPRYKRVISSLRCPLQARLSCLASLTWPFALGSERSGSPRPVTQASWVSPGPRCPLGHRCLRAQSQGRATLVQPVSGSWRCVLGVQASGRHPTFLTRCAQTPDL